MFRARAFVQALSSGGLFSANLGNGFGPGRGVRAGRNIEQYPCMFKASGYQNGFEIERIAACDFSRLEKVSNEEILRRARGPEGGERLLRFVTERMGIRTRYFVPPGMDALDLARDALGRLLEADPTLREEAEFLIFGGISNPMPTVCLSALLSGEFELRNVSCWDLKSGCSTGVLAAIQALEWFQHGARRGIIVCSETFSRFTHPETLQMSASVGDGAAALALRTSSEWKIRGVVHGTDPAYLKSMYVPGRYPVEIQNYRSQDYVFAFEEKGDTLKKMAEYWVGSLQDLLRQSGVKGEAVTHYFSHQVDAYKNREIARAGGIPNGAVAMNFADFGNMGCPTIFLNYAQWLASQPAAFRRGDVVVLHALGGGLSWAGICLEKIE